ncbi:MAG: BamA/OMP85 family outer membrane protein [Bacteriovoracaceae bacterium]
MVILVRFLILCFVLASSVEVMASNNRLICLQEEFCNKINEQLKQQEEPDLKEVLKRFSHISKVYQNPATEEFIVEVSIKATKLKLSISPDFSSEVDEKIRKILSFGNQKIIDSEMARQRVLSLKNFLSNEGYSNSKILAYEQRQEGERVLHVEVNTGQILRFEGYESNIQFKDLNLESFEQRFSLQKGKVFDKLKYSLMIQEIERSLINQGYVLARVEDNLVVSEELVRSTITIEVGQKVQFSVNGNKLISRMDLVREIKKTLRSTLTQREVKPQIEKAIQSSYKKIGYYFPQIEILKLKGRSRSSLEVSHYYIQIEEGDKTPIFSVDFYGTEDNRGKSLKEKFFKIESELIQSGFYDQNATEQFQKEIILYYQGQGFLSVAVQKPRVLFTPKEVKIVYNIDEGEQYLVSEMDVCDCDEETEKFVRSILINKEGKPFNINVIESDFKKALSFLKEKGYFYAFRSSPLGKDVVQYDLQNRKASIDYLIISGARLSYGGYGIAGLQKTKDYVVSREILHKDGDVLSPSSLRDLENRLNNLGLFQVVKVKPVKTRAQLLGQKKANSQIQIQVEERDFGSGEAAVGYRTDLGAKVSTSIVYNNVSGKNWIVSADAESNYRFSLSNLDARREAEGDKFIEYSLGAGITFPYFFDLPIRTNFSVGYKLQRYFAFDAEIARFTYSNDYQFLKNLFGRLKYQLETINQSDATEARDNDSFRIGSLTPSLTLDLRDRVVNPRRGSFFNVSWEFANPYFLSQNDQEDLVINFNRFISRSKFYLPVTNKITWANSISFGIETNFAKEKTNTNGETSAEGYIPSIKVFRLDGQDTIRGYKDSEINLLEGGQDIGEVIIDDEAYFLAYKTELRYSLNDQIVFGVFFDAGQVAVNSFSPTKVRTSLGNTFKFVTPVDSLDLDYGVKLKRRRTQISDTEQRREVFGRFHLSIGFF